MAGIVRTFINASRLAVGTVPTARLGSQSASVRSFLRGDQQWAGADSVIAVKTADTEVVNTVTTTTVFTTSIPGGTLGTQGALEIELMGNVENNSGGTRSPSMAMNYGGQSVFSGVFGSLNDATNRAPWIVRAVIYAQNSESVQRASLTSFLGIGDDADGGGITAQSTMRGGFNRALTVSSGGTQTLEITVTPDLAHANFSVRVDSVRVKALYA